MLVNRSLDILLPGLLANTADLASSYPSAQCLVFPIMLRPAIQGTREALNRGAQMQEFASQPVYRNCIVTGGGKFSEI